MCLPSEKKQQDFTVTPKMLEGWPCYLRGTVKCHLGFPLYKETFLEAAVQPSVY